MLSRSNTFILALAVIAAGVGGWLQHASRQAHAPNGVQVAAVGDMRPDLTLIDMEGKPRRLSEFHARRVLLNFWATWCAPCLKEMPALAEAQAKFGEKELIVVGIAMDDPERIRPFLAAHPVSYPILVGQMESPSTSLQFGDEAQVLPFSVLLDTDGRILTTQRGPLPLETLDDWMKRR
jgi:peroxiredoxin